MVPSDLNSAVVVDWQELAFPRSGFCGTTLWHRTGMVEWSGGVESHAHVVLFWTTLPDPILTRSIQYMVTISEIFIRQYKVYRKKYWETSHSKELVPIILLIRIEVGKKNQSNAWYLEVFLFEKGCSLPITTQNADLKSFWFWGVSSKS